MRARFMVCWKKCGYWRRARLLDSIFPYPPCPDCDSIMGKKTTRDSKASRARPRSEEVPPMPESCFHCPADAVVLVQDITDDYDPEYYCRDHDPRTTEERGA